MKTTTITITIKHSMTEPQALAWITDQIITGQFWGPKAPEVAINGKPVENPEVVALE